MSPDSEKRTAGTVPEVTISNRQRARKIDVRRLKEIAVATLTDLQIESAELGIILVGAKEMTSLNEEFLGHEGATDVITFDYSEAVQCRDAALRRSRPRKAGGRFAGGGAIIHGEIFVCISEAERQARIFEADWRSEVVRYIVHGILHLLGHDDLHPVARKKMKREEGRLVRELSRRFALSKL